MRLPERMATSPVFQKLLHVRSDVAWLARGVGSIWCGGVGWGGGYWDLEEFDGVARGVCDGAVALTCTRSARFRL